MSSEMREYVAALRDREHRFHGMGGHYVAEVIRGELEDILARTEAGADGAVSMNPIGYVDLASWQADWNASESFFTDYQDEDTQPIYTQAQMERAIEMAKAAHPQDASGDAETIAIATAFRIWEGQTAYWRGQRNARMWIREKANELVEAMQAKEAK